MITQQQQLFVKEYLRLRCKSATQAAITAGYSPKTASSQASQLLKNPKVLSFLEEQKSLLSQELREEFLFDALEARNVLSDILADPEASHRDKITVAKDFLDRAGFGGVTVALTGKEGAPIQVDTTPNINLADLSMEELEKLNDITKKLTKQPDSS